MGHFLNHPRGKVLVESIAQIFRERRVKIRRNHHLLFLCGGTESWSLRHRFLEYAREALPMHRIFLAETAFSDLSEDGQAEFINLADLERLICDISDTVLIFPESVGSFAEIGFFSAFDDLSTKVLVANMIDHQTSRSFLNIGPIHRVVSKSKFGQSVYITGTQETPNFSPVSELLTEAKHKRSYRIDPEDISEMPLKIRFFIVYFLISHFPILSAVEVSILVQNIFGKSSYREVRRLLSFLYASDYIERIPDEDLFKFKGRETILFDIDGYAGDALKAEILETYQKHVPHLLEL